MKDFIRQDSPFSCGSACVRMMLSRYLKSQRYLYEDETEVRHFLDMQRILNAYGVDTRGVRIKEHCELRKHPFSIVQIQNPGSTHFVVYAKTRGRSVRLLDPQSGERRMRISDFESLFTGYALIVISVREKKKRKPPVFRIAVVYDVAYLISLIVDLGVLSAMNALLSDIRFVLGGVAVLFASFILKLILNFALMRYVDRKYVFPFLDAGATYEEVGELSRWKSEEIRFRSRKIAYGSLTAFLIALLIYGDWKNLLLIVYLALILLMKRTLLKSRLMQMEESAARVEREKRQYPREAYSKVGRISKKFAVSWIFFSALTIFLGFFLLLFLCLLNSSFSDFGAKAVMTFGLFECGNRWIVLGEEEIESVKSCRYAFHRIRKKYRK